MPSAPQIVVADTGTGRVVVSLVGEHDVSTNVDFELALRGAMDASRGVVVDLSEATFIESSVLRTLLTAHAMSEASRTGVVVVVAPLESAAARLFGLVRAEEVLTVFPSLAEALEDMELPGSEVRP